MQRNRLLLLMVGLLTACKGAEEGEDATSDDGSSSFGGTAGSDGTDDGPCQQDAECPSGTICEDEACVDGDRNNALEEAEALLFDESVSGTINPVGDVDYYTFSSPGSEFLRLATVLEEEVTEYGGDTALVLRDPSGRVVAAVDDYPTESRVSGADSVIYAWLDEPGTYSVSVHDNGDYFEDPDDPADGFRAYAYSLSVSEWTRGTSDPDELESPSVVFTMDSQRSWVSTGVVIDTDGDADFLRIDLASALTDSHLVLDGNRDLTGSNLVPRFRVFDDAGTLLLDKSDVGPSGKALVPFIEGGRDYTVEVSDAAGTGSAAHWTFAHLIAVPDDYDGSTFEREEGSHDSLASAQALTQNESSTSGGNAYTYANLFGTVDAPEQGDWYALEAGYGTNYLGLCLAAGVYGALAEVSVELYDADGTLVPTAEAEAEAPAPADLYLANAAGGDGTWYLRVVPAEGTGGRAGDWYMLTAYIASFEASSYGCPDG